MRFIADFHIHSSYSIATSRDISPESLWRWAQIKGITVLGTGDFTHPAWFGVLREKLHSDGNGLFALKKKLRQPDVPRSCRMDVRFILSAEISTIYKKDGRTRKVHSVILVSSFHEAEAINKKLSAIGNLAADGRPILKLDVKELLQIVLDASPRGILIPAHAWTPHFSVLGASSGFGSLEECFEDLTPYIYAIETGLSSDPPMNWRLGGLDGVTLVSNSDAHSPSNIGREANILNTGVSYPHILDAIKTKEGFIGTIEFFPEAGKYHYDGHRNCGVSLSPEETIKHGGICPLCGKPLTVGVAHRVEALADRPEGFRPIGARDFHYIIPLMDILSEILKQGKNSKKVEDEYFRIIDALGSEFGILRDAPIKEIEKKASIEAAEAINAMRHERVQRVPGFDGRYGKVKIFNELLF